MLLLSKQNICKNKGIIAKEHRICATHTITLALFTDNLNVNRCPMIKNFLRLLVLAAVNIILITSTLYAQVDTVRSPINLDEVTITINRRASTYSELLRVVRVVQAEELGALEAISLPEMLERLAMVDIRQRGTHGVQSDINFRGGTFDQTLVLLNGININDPQTGHHSLNIPVPLESIKRIEILQGSGAREYGQGAFAGAINIITTPADSNNVQVAAYGAQHGLVKLNASASLGSKKFRTFLSASHDRSDGYIANTDFKTANLYLHSALQSRVGDFSLFVGFQGKGFGANSFYTPKFPNQYEATRVLVEGLQYRKVLGRTTIFADAYHRMHTDRFELFRSNPAPWYTKHNYHLTHVYGVKPWVQYAYSFGKTSAGAEIRFEEILSNNLGTTLSKPVPIGSNNNLTYNRGDSRSIFNTYISQTIYAGAFVVAGGAQFAFNNKFGSIWTWGADVSYAITSSLRAFASANRVYRTPTFTDLYYNGATNIGNPNLKPEFAIVYEGGLKYGMGNALSAQVAGYIRNGSNIIDWVRHPDSTKWTTVNYTQVKSQGFDLMLNASLAHLSSLIYGATFTYSFVNSDANSGALDSYYALDYLKHNLSLGMRHRFAKHFELGWTARYQSRTGSYMDFATSSQQRYPSFWLFDAQLSYCWRGITVYANVSNLFEARYIDIANIPQPGRWLGAGAKYRLGW